MQKHLRNLGLLDGSAGQSEELHAGHLQMMDMMLRNRERVLQQLVDLQRKLDAAEKVELYRRIRSGVTNAEELERSHVSRSLSRPARSALGNGRFSREGGGHRRQQSHSPEAGDLIKRVETDYRADSAPIKNSKSIYNRLAANAYKYQYLHKLDDRTLRKYMNSLRKQLAKLERFREVSFGPHTMAKHQPAQLQQSWFFRRRSLPSLEAAVGATNNSQSQQTNGGWRSLKSGRKSRSGKSQSPRRAGAAADEPLTKMRRTSMSRTRATQKLPPLPQTSKRSFTGNRSMPTPSKSMEQKLPPTGITKQTKKTQERPPRRSQPTTVQKAPGIKTTPIGARPPSSKGSITPVKVQKPPSMSGALPVIGAAVGAAGVAAVAATIVNDDERPSPSISLAASQTTTTDGQPAGDSEWEGDQVEAPAEVVNEEEARPTPGPFEGETEVTENHMEGSEGQLTARTEVKSAAKEELMEGQDEVKEENEVKMKNEEEIKREVISPVGTEAVGSGMEEDEYKNISSSPKREGMEESEEIPQEPTQACSLQQHYERVKREAEIKAEEKEDEEVFEQPVQKEEIYEDKENEGIISPKEEIVSTQSSENIIMNGGHYEHNEEVEGSERSMEIKEESLKEAEPISDEEKRLTDSRVSFAKSEDSIEGREDPSERQKSEEAVVEMEELSNQNVENEENIQESPVKVTITPSPENKSWGEEEEMKEQKEDEDEEKFVVMAESPAVDETSISQNFEAGRDENVELEGSPRVEEQLGQSESPLDSTRSVVNGINYGEGQETQNEEHEAERDLEHRYELPESKTVSDYVEEPSEHYDENKNDEVFEEGHRMKRDVDGFGEGKEYSAGKEEEHFGEEEEVHTGREEEHIGREENGFGREESQHTGRDEEHFGREEEEFEQLENKNTERESDKHIESEEEQLSGREVYTEREEHTGSVKEEHNEEDNGDFRREELHSGSENQYTEREERMTGREDVGIIEGEEERLRSEDGEQGREDEHTGREEHLGDNEVMTGGGEENTRLEHAEQEEIIGKEEEDDHFEKESQHTGRETVELIKGPDETEFEQLVESESVQPSNEDTSRKLSGSEKFIQLESGERGSVQEDRPETMMSLGNNSQVLPDEASIMHGTSELDTHSKGGEDEIDEANLVHSEETEYNRPESKTEVSEVRHEDEPEYEPENEDISGFGHQEVQENGSEIQHEEVSESRQEVEPEITSRKSEDMSEVGHENFSEARHEDVQENISEVRPESEQEVSDRNVEDRTGFSPEVVSEARLEEVFGDGHIGEFDQDGSINNFGSPNLTSKEGEGTEFYERNEDETQRTERENESETFRSEHSEKQSLNEKEEQSLQLSESPNLLASGYEDDARSNQSKPFLQQPSIEITPASDHKYVGHQGEDEPNSEHSQPMSPVGEESQQQQPPVEWRNYEQQDIHQEENRNNNNNYQEQLIDFSSSPTAQGDEIIDISHQSQHSPHQNGHLKNYEDHENEDDENTSLLTYRTENEDSPSKKSNNNYKGENGHLLMGNGENSGRLSSSSTETEGADHENNNSDSSSVVIRQGTSTSLEHGQQHFQKLETEGRIEQL
uniref:Uncharacterized protein n=1 Tax=Meloidogyne enterolobii TaxID=390850 RepID=A0A6V7UMG8_MELEN|nr:unnamed protein product [Meloidogyne enterolobii]